MKKTTLGIIIAIIIIGLGVYLATRSSSESVKNGTQNPDLTTQTDISGDTTDDVAPPIDKTKTVIGTSVGGNAITAYHYGEGDTELLFVGGIHGGYEWNTTLVAYQMMDYLKENPAAVPSNLKVTVIPVLNPDGLEKVVGTTTAKFSASDVSSNNDIVIAGRFNGNDVDLNRNFDCDWQANAKWQSKNVSGGTAAFSEPEAQAIKEYVEAQTPASVVVWYSAAGGVFASSCHNGVSDETNALTSLYAKASGYLAYKSFDFYATTGDMVNWLAKMKIPAISVLLTNHTDTEWTKNKAGIEAVIKHYAQ